MANQYDEICVHGSKSKWMADFLINRGCTLIRIDPIQNYVFINNTIFENALVELWNAIDKGFYIAQAREEVNAE